MLSFWSTFGTPERIKKKKSGDQHSVVCCQRKNSLKNKNAKGKTFLKHSPSTHHYTHSPRVESWDTTGNWKSIFETTNTVMYHRIQTSQGFPFQTETELHHTTSLNGNWAEIKILHQNKKKLLRFVCLFAKRFSLYESAHISFQHPMTCLTDFNPSDDPIIPDSYWLLVTQQTEHW